MKQFKKVNCSAFSHTTSPSESIPRCVRKIK